ncbi:hypothetical protein [Actinocrispum wychmicini]|uniref:hypothetical protein n=1 Tax=Actinocrispum wychmicini TaxID=1213861 RepID=UPI001046397D|nr:hypothetical protein [Actinocrispum wychmicini]
MSQVPLWVTILVAFVGFVGVLSAQLIAAWREDRRWRREQEREELRWRRERQRELDNRDFDLRKDSYAQVISAVEAFDWIIYPIIKGFRRDPQLNAEDLADARRVREELRHSLGQVNLYAPTRFNDLLRGAMLPRSNLVMELINDQQDREKIETLWDSSQTGYRRMRAEMRRDLGLDAEDLPDDWAYDLSVRHYREELAEGETP